MISTLKKKLNKKGFTLAELLIVVAIIAVLAAIAIPVFGAQLNKAKHNANVANVRAAYAEVLSTAMINDTNASGEVVLAMKPALASVKLTTDTKVTFNGTAAEDATSGCAAHSILVATSDSDTTTIKIDSEVNFYKDGVVTVDGSGNPITAVYTYTAS